MDVEEKVELILREPTEEVITVEELRNLFETKSHPVVYNGFEPSGPVHLGTGVICAYKMKDCIEAGCKVKVFLATYHAWINNKLGGDLEKIKLAAEHFKHSWIALGVPEDKVEFVMADELYDDVEYWRKVLLVAKEISIARARRTLEIAGRSEIEAKKVSDLIYTPMQVADIFHMNIDICQLGMDQRKANVVAREVGPKLGFWKPVCVHHHLLQGLAAPPKWPLSRDELKVALSSLKMSKSKPETSIYIYDSPEDIRRKIRKAFCPPGETSFNPVLDIMRYIIFREYDEVIIKRPRALGGGEAVYHGFDEVKRDYERDRIHPLDLKESVTKYLIEILKPVREYFEKNASARRTLEFIKSVKITR